MQYARHGSNLGHRPKVEHCSTVRNGKRARTVEVSLSPAAEPQPETGHNVDWAAGRRVADHLI